MRQFCYVAGKLSLQESNGVKYVLDASHQNLPLYFAMKGKNEYEMAGQGFFFEDLRDALSGLFNNYDIVVIPESRFSFLDYVISDFPNVLRMKKRNKLEICNLALQTPTWRKLDKLSAQKAWDEMGNTFTMNTIKANKRQDYIPHLFVPYRLDPSLKVLIADDFVMSGNTVKALSVAIGRTDYDTLGIFYQTKEQI